MRAAAAEAAHVVEENYTTVAQGSAEYNRKAVEAALSNADTFFDYALAPLTAKSPTEIISGRDRADQGGFGARPKVGDRDRRAAQNRHHKRVEEGRLTFVAPRRRAAFGQPPQVIRRNARRSPGLNYLPSMLWRSPSPARHPPGFIEPCLPTLGHAVPSGSQWVHEIKHDGYRFICRR